VRCDVDLVAWAAVRKWRKERDPTQLQMKMKIKKREGKE
jgi:hypothetical protein